MYLGYINDENNTTSLDYSNADSYAECYAIAKDGEIWAYIGGYIVDTGINISLFSPTINYTLNSTNWTNEPVTLNFTENTTSSIVEKNVKKGKDIVTNEDTYTIEKNGEYIIEVSDSKGMKYEAELKIDNIDKIKPNVAYTGKIENGVANIVASDKADKTGDNACSGIAKIELTYETPTIDTEWVTLEGEITEEGKMIAQVKQIQETQFAYVRAIDNAGNSSTIRKIEFKDEFKEQETIDVVEIKEENANKGQEILISEQASIAYVIIGSLIVIGVGILMIFKEYRM